MKKVINNEIAKFINNNAENMTISEIAQVFNITDGCIRDYCNRYNIKYKKNSRLKITPEIENIINNNAENMTTHELVKLTGLKYSTLINYCKKHNIKYKKIIPNPVNPINSTMTLEIKELINNNAKNMTLKELSELTGLKYSTLTNYCRKYNIKCKKSSFLVITPEIENIINNNAENMTLTQLCKLTRLKYNTLFDYCKKHNIKYKNRTKRRNNE